jgi:hypothetical protein
MKTLYDERSIPISITITDREHTFRYGIEEGTLVTTEPCGDGVLIRPAVVVPGRDIHQNARRSFSSPPLQLRKTTAAHSKG